MQSFVLIDFKPQNTYKDWIFNGVNKEKEQLKFFSKTQIEEKLNNVLEQIPNIILEKFEKLGWTIIITNTRKLEEEIGVFYEIYGYTNFKLKQFVVYATEEGIDGLFHEFGHFVDFLLLISKTNEWNSIYKEEKDGYLSMSLSFTKSNNKEETFADAFEFYLRSKKDLSLEQKGKKIIPKTYCVIDNILKYIDYILNDDNILKNNNLTNVENEFYCKIIETENYDIW